MTCTFKVIHYYLQMYADVFNNFRNKFIEIYEFDPAHLLSAPELAWKAC